jgi:hypothetical protein
VDTLLLHTKPTIAIKGILCEIARNGGQMRGNFRSDKNRLKQKLRLVFRRSK